MLCVYSERKTDVHVNVHVQVVENMCTIQVHKLDIDNDQNMYYMYHYKKSLLRQQQYWLWHINT